MGQKSQPVIGHRYQILDQIGVGGMGEVYRVADRLTGQTVALKRVTVPSARLQFASRASTYDSVDFRVALAQEFRTLASLRHPNIISVLDYGFDDERQPYLTMELLSDAQNILAAGRGQTMETQVELLVQVLQALTYLHRRGVIHRDLKPDNVMVVGGQVKVLDFGLALDRQYDDPNENATAGTIAYMAPEVLTGEPASQQSDLYAFGIIAYELFAGKHPFTVDDAVQLVQQILHTVPDVKRLELSDGVAAVLQRLMAKSPRERFADTRELLDAYRQTIGQPLQVETASIRESYLQAAEFVGREAELGQLTAALEQATLGRGSAWLAGGESGVGKSRLVDELRIRALVGGAWVLRGQAVSTGSAPYQLWREPLRWLCLHTPLSDLEASVLKPLVPDIGRLLERDVPDAPEIDPEAAQNRLLTVIEEVFRRQRQPLVVLLEDVQWAGEGLHVLKRLLNCVAELPLLIIANYRDDERPELRRELVDMRHLKLERLPTTAIARLSESMLGESGKQPGVVDLLQRETEGNAFFIVEVVRVLAEEAGQLDRVGMMPLPSKVFAGGMKTVVQRRLSRVPEDAHPLLKLAAVAGRELDLDVLRTLAPDVYLPGWLAACANTSVLEVLDDRWRFAHDKLREGVLSGLSADEQRTLNREVAGAIEETYPDDAAHVAVLARHWGEAGDVAKEAYYSALAGEQALENGAYQEAVTYLQRATALAGQTHTPRPRRVALERELATAYYGLGNIEAGLEHLKQAVHALGRSLPASRQRLLLSMTWQLVLQLARRVWSAPFTPRSSEQRAIMLEAARVYEWLGNLYYFTNEPYLLINAWLHMLNRAEALGPSPILARAYACVSLIIGLLPLHKLAESYVRKAKAVVAQVDDLSSHIWVSEFIGIYSTGLGKWQTAYAELENATDIATRLGNQRRWEECWGLLSWVPYLRGEFTRAAEMCVRLYHEAHRSGHTQAQSWGLLGQAVQLMPTGRLDEVLALLDAALALPSEHFDRFGRIWTYGILALARWRHGETQLALDAAQIALDDIAVSMPTSSVLFESYAGMVEVYLSQWAACADAAQRPMLRKQAARAVKELQRYARVFPIARARASLWQGWYEQLDGKPAQAAEHWRKSLEQAQALAMPYDEGLAHEYLGRYLPDGDPQREHHRQQALGVFERLGADWHFQRARSSA